MIQNVSPDQRSDGYGLSSLNVPLQKLLIEPIPPLIARVTPFVLCYALHSDSARAKYHDNSIHIRGRRGDECTEGAMPSAYLMVIIVILICTECGCFHCHAFALHYLGKVQDGIDGVDGLYGTNSVTVSPDNRIVYTTGWADNAVAYFGIYYTGSDLVIARSRWDTDGNGQPSLPDAITALQTPAGKYVPANEVTEKKEPQDVALSCGCFNLSCRKSTTICQYFVQESAFSRQCESTPFC